VNNIDYRLALVTALLPLFVAGCATQGAQSAEAANPGARTPQVAAAAPPPAVVAPLAVKPVQPLQPPSAIETEYGLQIAHVGLTAAGGLVDVRFKVLDAIKARKLLGDAAHAPMLIAGDNPPLMPPHHALKGAKFAKGQVFYILYPNVRSAIQPGVEVTVAMGDVRLGPVTAQ
jgi:hypothetical protein